jgi:hypothetical protein
VVPLEHRRYGDSALLPGDGVAHNDLAAHTLFDEDETVAAAEQIVIVVVAEYVVAVEQIVIVAVAGEFKGQASRGDAVGRVKDGVEHDTFLFSPPQEDAEQGRLPVVCIELAVELGVGDDAPPLLAYGGCAREGGRLRRETEENLPQHVVAVRQGGSSRGRAATPTAAASADHSGALHVRLDMAMEARAAAGCHPGSFLTHLGLWMEARAAASDHSSGVPTRLDLRTGARAAAACHPGGSSLAWI